MNREISDLVDAIATNVFASRGFSWAKKFSGVLIHDSHIFDGVDGRQIGLALAARSKTAPYCERAGFGQISALISLNRQAIRLNQDENLPQTSTLSRRHLFLNGLLELAHKKCEELGVQYVVAMNSEDLLKIDCDNEQFNPSDYVLDTVLTDKLGRGLFGLLFSEICLLVSEGCK